MVKRDVSVQKVQSRPGEGHLIDMTVVSSDSDTLTIALDAQSLPVPDRKYSCDAAQVIADDFSVRLLLGQRQPVGSGLLSMLVVTLAPESVGQFLGSLRGEFVDNAAKYVSGHHGRVALSTFTENAQQSVVLTSSYIVAGYTGLSSCLDFYFASPFSVQQMAALKKLALEPVVRVNLSTGLLLSLIDAVRNAAQESKWRVFAPDM